MKKELEYTALTIVTLTLALSQSDAYATPARCSAGYEDTSCANPIAAAPQTPPTCPASTATVGVITVTPAQWEGSHFSAPQCEDVGIPGNCTQSYGAGYYNTANWSWNGSAWVGQSCGYAAPPGNCTQVDGAGYYNTANWSWNGSAWVGQTCGYQAPPTCPPGETQQTAPSWNGAGWVGLVCTQSLWTQTQAQDACLQAWYGVSNASQLTTNESLVWNGEILPYAQQSGNTITYRLVSGGGQPDSNGNPTCGTVTTQVCVAQLSAQTASYSSSSVNLGSCNQGGH